MRGIKTNHGLSLVELVVGLVVSGLLATICTSLLVGQLKELERLRAEASVETEFALFEAEIRRAWQSRNRLEGWGEAVEPFAVSFKGRPTESELLALGWPCVSREGPFRFRLEWEGTAWVLETATERPDQVRRLRFNKLGRIDCLVEENASKSGSFPRRIHFRFPEMANRPSAAFALW